MRPRRLAAGRRHSSEGGGGPAVQPAVPAPKAPPARPRNQSPDGGWPEVEATNRQQQQQQDGALGKQQLAASRAPDGGRRQASAAGKRQGPKLKARQATGIVSDTSASQQQQQQEFSSRQQVQFRHANSEQSGHDRLPLQAMMNSLAEANNGPANANKGRQAMAMATPAVAMARPHCQAGRPQSALAGTASNMMGADASPTATTANASSKVRRDSAGAVPSTNAAATPGRPKTTRVRINSTSEQIQDPNWLIRMSRELEQPQQKKSHLRSLQRKLKSTISGGGGGQSSAASANNHQQPASQLDETLVALPPATPVKVPVSILKQRSPSGRQPNQQPAPRQTVAPAAPAPAPATVGGRPRPTGSRTRQQQTATTTTTTTTTVPPQTGSLQNHPGPSQTHQNHHQQQPPPPAPAHLSKLAVDQQQQQQSHDPSQRLQTGSHSPHRSSANATTSGASSSSRPEPICAEGQVRVSGWKRNNLLAKTLSHLDEIRGNQRPVFVPTKIRLPAEAVASAPSLGGGGGPSHPLARSPSPTPSASKFAEIVREAMASKRELQQHKQQATKRTSDGECKEPHESRARLGSVVRAVSADPTVAPPPGSPGATAGPALQPPQASPGQPTHRSSSAGLAGPNPKQQVIVSLNWANKHSGGGGRDSLPGLPLAASSPGSLQSPSSVPRGSAATALATPHLMSQLLSVSAQQSLLESGSSSSRQFKLQHKNNQVLQNLRRQSNELQASLNAAALRAAADEAAGGGGSTSGSCSPSGGGPGRTKDWKRLAGKLGLLASGRHTLSVPRSPLGSLSGADSGPTPLRLTVSNQETGGERLAQKRGSGHAQQQSLLVPGQSRKLSSSSMVMDAMTRAQHQASLLRHPASGYRARANSPRLSDHELMPQVSSPRRNSDSEAYRAPKTAPGGVAADPAAGGSNPFTSSPADDGDDGDGAEQRRPVVVNRDDLLQLLQVATGSGGSTDQDQVGQKPVSGPEAGSDGADKAAAAVEPDADSGDSGHTIRSWCEGATAAVATASEPSRAGNAAQRFRARSSSVKSMDGLVVGGVAAAANERAAEAPEAEQVAGPEVAGGKSSRRTDLSWVVKKTSKVVFFHEKLRKIRWHMKQSNKGQQKPTTTTTTAAATEEREGEETDKQEVEAREPLSGLENKLDGPVGKRSGDVFMDPTLIGDAIEIFLRSTMQAGHKSASEGEQATANNNSSSGRRQSMGQQESTTLQCGDRDNTLRGANDTRGGHSGQRSPPPPSQVPQAGPRLIVSGGGGGATSGNEPERAGDGGMMS